MHSSRSVRSTYLAAFLLGSLLALLFVAPARAAQPFRLDRIAVVRFSALENGQLRRHSGVMTLEGQTQWRIASDIDRPANTPDWALEKTLITVSAWLAYYQLSPQALDNFELGEGSIRFAIGDESYHFVYPREDAYFAAGTLVNLSTRAKLAGPGDVIIAGFVVHDRPRAVLVRAVGPSLVRHGVANAAPDPVLTLKRQDQTVTSNDNWNDQPDTPFLRKVATRVGAGPLDEGARDAACLVLLDPGVYTAQVQTAGTSAGGDVVIEIYDVPPDVILEGEFGS